MPKEAKLRSTKVNRYIKDYPNEFQMHPNNDLYCILCNVVVNYERRSTIIKHRETGKHSKYINEKSSKQVQTFMSIQLTNKDDYANYVVKAFLSANIPIYKVNNPDMKSLFNYVGRPLPSETKIRSMVESVAEDERLKVKNFITGKNIFSCR